MAFFDRSSLLQVLFAAFHFDRNRCLPPLWVNGKPDSTNPRKGRALRSELFVVLERDEPVTSGEEGVQSWSSVIYSIKRKEADWSSRASSTLESSSEVMSADEVGELGRWVPSTPTPLGPSGNPYFFSIFASSETQQRPGPSVFSIEAENPLFIVGRENDATEIENMRFNSLPSPKLHYCLYSMERRDRKVGHILDDKIIPLFVWTKPFRLNLSKLIGKVRASSPISNDAPPTQAPPDEGGTEKATGSKPLTLLSKWGCSGYLILSFRRCSFPLGQSLWPFLLCACSCFANLLHSERVVEVDISK
ncbi:hypothetical protein ACH5RR_021492 [Cinchona calisaya]|uniref:Uncharacterized protein n=1 Tax=Cinchona calisaya TaxID=153742 RepID=A0ABD2ZIP0_9GENT